MSKNIVLRNNIQYEISQRNNKIEELTNENNKYIGLIHSLQSELFSLKNKNVNNKLLEKEIKSYQDKNIELVKEVKQLKLEILDIHKKYNEEKRKYENEYNEQIKKLKADNEGFRSKIDMVNELAREKNGLLKAFDKILQERNNMLFEHDKLMREKEINNQIKITNLKKKMIDSVQETQSKVNELNSEYKDVSSKLTVLHNQQLLIKLQYINQNLEELTAKNESLEKKIFELKKDIDIHKKVEVSLAEKNKKLIYENNQLKGKNKKENEKKISKLKLMSCNSSINFGEKTPDKYNTNSNNKIIQLEAKIFNLEKKLNTKQKEYNEIKDKNNSIENILKNYEEKYSGFFNYFEECLKMFINDKELKNNKDIFINIDYMKKGDFTKLNNEEKYSTLIILMKYLMPFIHNTESGNNINTLNNVNLKCHFLKNIKSLNVDASNEIIRKNKKKHLLKRIITKKLFNKTNSNLLSPSNSKYNSFDNFPNIGHKLISLSSKKTTINIKNN